MEKEKEKIKYIRKMLNEMHTKWRNDPNEDGHCKSAEGLIEIIATYPNWFEARDYENDKAHISVSIYSYLFGPSRMHDFNSVEEAFEEVKQWYKKYMGHPFSTITQDKK